MHKYKVINKVYIAETIKGRNSNWSINQEKEAYQTKRENFGILNLYLFLFYSFNRVISSNNYDLIINIEKNSIFKILIIFL